MSGNEKLLKQIKELIDYIEIEEVGDRQSESGIWKSSKFVALVEATKEEANKLGADIE